MKIEELMKKKIQAWSTTMKSRECEAIKMTVGEWLRINSRLELQSAEILRKQAALVEQIRTYNRLISAASLNEEQREALKNEKSKLKRKLMCAAPCAYFTTSRSKRNVKYYTGLLVIDIDAGDNPKLTPENIDAVCAALANEPFVVAVNKSVSGAGIAVYCYIGQVRDNEEFEEAFYSLERYFKKAGLVVDASCKDSSRLRIISSDAQMYIADSEKKLRKWEGREKTIAASIIYRGKDDVDSNEDNLDYDSADDTDYEKLRREDKLLRLADVIKNYAPQLFACPTYNQWVVWAFRLQPFGEVGLQVFKMISLMNNPGEREDTITMQFKHCQGAEDTQTGTLRWLEKKLKKEAGEKWKYLLIAPNYLAE